MTEFLKLNSFTVPKTTKIKRYAVKAYKERLYFRHDVTEAKIFFFFVVNFQGCIEFSTVYLS